MTREELKELISECVVEETARIQEENAYVMEHADEIIKEAYVDLYIEENAGEDEVLEEGANLDSRKIFKEGKKEYKENVRKIKGLIKSGDTAEAKKTIEAAKKGIDKMESGIKATESDAGSAILGYFATGLLNTWELLLPSLGITAGAAAIGGATGVVMGKKGADMSKIADTGYKIGLVSNIPMFAVSIVKAVKDIKQFIETLKSDAGTADKLNLYKNKLLRYCKDLKKQLDKLEKKAN